MGETGTSQVWTFLLAHFRETESQWEQALLGHLIYLSFGFKDEKSKARKGSPMKLSGW